MKLYHGTSAKNFESILKEGIKPRGKTNGNWEHSITSRPDCVYLSTVYAPYFAINSVENDSSQCALLEINTDSIDKSLLLPDEDFLEQATREKNSSDSMEKRTMYYRDTLILYANFWQQSLDNLGTCAYKGTIHPSAIVRATVFDTSECKEMAWMAMDPTITIINHKLFKDKYKALTSWFIGDTINPENLSLNKEHWEMTPPEAQAHLIKTIGNQSMIQRVA